MKDTYEEFIKQCEKDQSPVYQLDYKDLNDLKRRVVVSFWRKGAAEIGIFDFCSDNESKQVRMVEMTVSKYDRKRFAEFIMNSL